MTCTTDLCACGCGQRIGPDDPDPYFVHAGCQKLWLASQFEPEHDRVRWRGEQRFFHELWFTTSWKALSNFQPSVDCHHMRSVANLMLSDYGSMLRPFGVDELEDVLRLLVHRWNLLHSRSDDFRLQVLPGWVTSRRGIERELAVDRIRTSSAATLDSVSHA